MVFILVLTTWTGTSFMLICFAKMLMMRYDTTFCRDVRACLGMFVYASQVEEWRKALNRPNSKF